MKFKLTLVACLVMTCLCNAQDLKTISKSYVDAYFSLDQATYKEFLADDVTWSDPTWSEVDPTNKPVKGKEAMLRHLVQATDGVTNMSYTIGKHFVSANLAVFEGIMKYTWTDANSGKAYKFEIPEITILEFREGKIVKHTDYADFKTWKTQFQSQ